MEISKKHSDKPSCKNLRTPVSKNLEIFVGGLPSHTTAPMLTSYFKKFGQVKKAKPQGWKSGARRCRGFGIVKCGDRATYDRILTTMHSFEGRTIECKPCLRKAELARYNEELSQRKAFIGNLPAGTTSRQLQELFKGVGHVEMAYVVQKRGGRGDKGIGYVTFSTREECEKAVETGRFKLRGRQIVCAPYQNKGFEEKKKANPGNLRNFDAKKKEGHPKKGNTRTPKIFNNKIENPKTELKKSDGVKSLESKTSKNQQHSEERSEEVQQDQGGHEDREQQRKKLIQKFQSCEKDSECNPESFFKFTDPSQKDWHRLFRARRIDNSFKGYNYRMNCLR